MSNLERSRYAFFLALSFLTRIPIPNHWFTQDLSTQYSQEFTAQLHSYSVLFYPLIGLSIGLLLGLFSEVVFNTILHNTSTLIQATLLITIWIWVTGALHLDGFADAIDAACAGHKNTNRTLEIFKDPNAGPMAVVALILLITCKILLINELLLHSSSLVFIICFATLLSRQLAVVYMAITPYARQKEGIALAINLTVFKRHIFIISIACIIITFVYHSFLTSLLVIAFLVGWLYYWRTFWVKRIKGYTGDCVGALIEAAEIIILFICVLIV